MHIHIKTIPHSEQRYDTCGDYFYAPDGTDGNGGDDASVQVRISNLGNPRYEWLVLIHELVEFALVSLAGISIEDIDAFDKNFESSRLPGNKDEPGDDPRAPYFHQHQAATAIERVFAVLLGVDWHEYECAIINL